MRLALFHSVCEMDSCTIVFQVFIPAKLAFKGEIAKSLLIFFYIKVPHFETVLSRKSVFSCHRPAP